jgi:hypothetical protein
MLFAIFVSVPPVISCVLSSSLNSHLSCEHVSLMLTSYNYKHMPVWWCLCTRVFLEISIGSLYNIWCMYRIEEQNYPAPDVLHVGRIPNTILVNTWSKKIHYLMSVNHCS